MYKRPCTNGVFVTVSSVNRTLKIKYETKSLILNTNHIKATFIFFNTNFKKLKYKKYAVLQLTDRKKFLAQFVYNELIGTV